MKKIITIALMVIVGIYLLLWVAPYLVKNHFNNNAEKYIGRKASIGELSFNPFRFSLHAADFKVFEKDDHTEFLGFKQLDVNLNFLKRITGVYQIEEISIDSPFVNVISYGNGFSFDDLLATDSAATVEEDEESSETIAFEIFNLKLTKGEVTYYDRVRDNKVIMDHLAFLLPHFAYDSESANMDLKLVINETGHLSINNSFYPNENRLECNVKLGGLDLEIAKPYVADYIAFTELNGKVGADLNINLLLKDTTDIIIEGDSWISELSVRDSSAKPYLSIDSLHAYVDEIDVLEENYDIGDILIKGMFLRYDALDSTTSLDAALAPLYANEKSMEDEVLDSSQTASTDTVSNLKYSIDTVLIVESHIEYRDYRLDERFVYNITEITALGTNIRSDSSKATFSSNGVLNEVGTYNANLVLSPQDPLNFDLDFAVKGFHMGDISPFTITYAGHPIFDGDLVYTGHTVVNNGIMQSENKVIIYDLEVGDKASGNFLVAVPLKFAVFLLKDKDGVVNLNMPMEGNLYDPDFKIGPLIWQIVKQNLEKAVAAPGKMLASQFGIDPKQIQYISFNPLDTTLNEDGKNTVAKLEELVTKKPGLIVNFAYYEPSNIEVQTYAYRKAKERYVQAKLKYKLQEEFRKLVNKTDDKDIHFVAYMNEQLGTNSSDADSLALALIGSEEAVKSTSNLVTIRKEALGEYIVNNSTLKESDYHFIDLKEVPKFPAETSGFVVKFEIK